MFNAPPTVQATVFASVPDAFRQHETAPGWIAHQPGKHPHHSLLEGPVFDEHGNFFCVDVLWGRIFRVDAAGRFSLLHQYQGEPNGLKFHPDGRLVIADYAHGILALDPETGKMTPLVERVRLERLKAVNDLTFARNGDLYFTDQGLTGLHDPTGRVFRLRSTGEIDCLLDNVPSPNGLALSVEEDVLFVAATRANAVWRVPLMRDGTVAKVGTFIQLSGGIGPDGIAVDAQGNLVVAHVGLGAVWVFDERGEPRLRVNSPCGYSTTNVALREGTVWITEASSGSILQAAYR